MVPLVASSLALYIGIDSGTQGLKALVYDAQTKAVVGRAAQTYPMRRDGPIAEQDPTDWVDAMYDATDRALQDAEKVGYARNRVRAIGVSGQQHGLVALDADYRVIRPAKLWCDTESAPEAAELSATLARPLVASFTATKLLWLKRNEPDNFARLAHVALPHDYLNWHLCGRLVMECGDASGTGLLSPARREWDANAVESVDPLLLGKLPPLLRPDEWVGCVTPAAAERLGLERTTHVSVGGGDNMMSALGCGCATNGRVAVSLGTSGTIFGRTDAAADDPSGTVCPFLDATGGGLPLLCTLNCATVPEEVVAAYGLTRDALSALAEAEPAGCEGLTLTPYFAGERTPNLPEATGVLAGIRPGFLARPGLVYRAAIEGATFALKAGLSTMQRHGLPEKLSELRVVGGGSQSTLWRQTLADATGVRVACPTEPESAALGAALQAAAVDAGVVEGELGAWIARHHDPPVSDVVEPIAANVDALQRAFELYEERTFKMFAL